MRINEIQRMPAAGFSDLEDFLSKPVEAPKKRLPGGSGYTYSVFGNGIGVQIYDKNNPKGPDYPIAKLVCKDLGSKFPINNTVEVRLIGVDENYRGQGLAKALYGIVLSILKRPIVAGNTQTPGGRMNWVSISQVPGVEVYGYVTIPSDLFNDNKHQNKIVDTLMSKLGAQYIGEATPYSSGGSQHFFAFPVGVNTKKNELQALVNTQLSQVYHRYKNSKWETGLYATYSQ